MRKPARPTNIIVETSGGVVQSVCSSSPGVKVTVLDWDDVRDETATPAVRNRVAILDRRARRMHVVF